MFEVPDSGKDHRDIERIGFPYHFFVPDRAARLYYRGDTTLVRLFYPVFFRKEGIAGEG
jgi:hypothetical protein